MTRKMSGILDFLRWVSAVCVVITHSADLMVARFPDTPHALRTPLLYLYIFSAGFGHQAVMVFYVLSGFLVGGPLIAKIRRNGALPWKKYFIDRLVRIYLVLVPALVLCAILDRITYQINPAWTAEFIHGHSAWWIFAGNLLNLQNFFVPFFGSNGPIGTLAIEMWFYISFPLFLAAFLSRYSLRTRILLFLLGAGINITLGWAQPAYLLGFVIWCIGASARVWTGPAFRRALPPSALLIICLLAIRAIMRRSISQNTLDLFLADLALAVTLHLLLVAALRLPDSTSSFFTWKIHKRLAGFSYSLYAIHMPLLFLLTATSRHLFGFGIKDVVAHPYQWLLVLAAIFTCAFAAWLFSLLTEHHTNSVRRWVYARTNTTREAVPDASPEPAPAPNS